MSCQKKQDAINTAIVIVGGITLATVGIAAIVAAPLEIVTTAVVVGGMKYALDRNNAHKHTEECEKDD